MKKVPNNKYLGGLRKAFLDYYLLYIRCTTVIWSILFMSQLFANLNCLSILKPGLLFFVTLGNCAKLATPICLSFIRYSDPMVKKNVHRKLKFLRRCLLSDGRTTNQSLLISLRSSAEYEENYFDRLE